MRNEQNNWMSRVLEGATSQMLGSFAAMAAISLWAVFDMGGFLKAFAWLSALTIFFLELLWSPIPMLVVGFIAGGVTLYVRQEHPAFHKNVVGDHSDHEEVDVRDALYFLAFGVWPKSDLNVTDWDSPDSVFTVDGAINSFIYSHQKGYFKILAETHANDDTTGTTRKVVPSSHWQRYRFNLDYILTGNSRSGHNFYSTKRKEGVHESHTLNGYYSMRVLKNDIENIPTEV